MRDIKFRGRRKDNNECVYGDLIHTPESKTRIIWFEYESDDFDGFSYKVFNKEVKPESIGQFTGVKDCKGVDIYEGDRVEITGKPYKVKNSTVVWGKKSHGWKLKCEVLNDKWVKVKYYSLESKKVKVL